MGSRDAVMTRIRNGLKVRDGDMARLTAVNERLDKNRTGIIPARGRIDKAARLQLFAAQAEAVHATVEILSSYADLPKAVADHLRSKNLAAMIRMGDDPRLDADKFRQETSLEIKPGTAETEDMAGLSHASAAIAETGTLVMESGPDNPTGINFLSEYHLVVVDGEDITGDLESIWPLLREKYGKGSMPRTVNLITGPSLSGDIEQTLLLGAHGPRSLHIMVIDRK